MLFTILNAPLTTAFAQGNLTPSGPPEPTMVTLLQIEPRTPISSVPFTISVPGSYYFTTNLTVSSGTGLETITADSCYGYSINNGSGIVATSAQSCFGQSSGSGIGISCNPAPNSYGLSSSSYGVYTSGTATGCYGYSSSGTG